MKKWKPTANFVLYNVKYCKNVNIKDLPCTLIIKQCWFVRGPLDAKVINAHVNVRENYTIHQGTQFSLILCNATRCNVVIFNIEYKFFYYTIYAFLLRF